MGALVASKVIAYAAMTPPVAENVSKVVAYAILIPPVAENVSKVIAYAVLQALPSANTGNMFFIG